MCKIKKIKIIFLVLLMLSPMAPISSVKADFHDILAEQQNLSKEINNNRSIIADLEEDIQSLDSKMDETYANAAREARAIQVSNVTNSMINEIFSSRSITDFVQKLVNINMIVSATNTQMITLQKAKEEKAQALSKMKTEQIELEQNQQKLEKSIDAFYSNVSHPTLVQVTFSPKGQMTLPSSNSGSVAPDVPFSEAQARANIVARESNGNYQARNGRYYGAYQLDLAYLKGDISPANQDATAQAYVINRYGSWVNAWNFWQRNGYY